MDEKNLELIEEERIRLLEEYSKMTPGCEDAKDLLDDLDRLTKIAADQEKIIVEQEKNENDRKAKKWDRIKDIALSIGGGFVKLAVGIGGPVLVTIIGNKFLGIKVDDILKFEESGGYVSSTMGKALIGSIVRRK
jgi:hypothetical protein